jgi:hypothetical protein
MIKFLGKVFILGLFLFFIGFFFVPTMNAASLSSVSDTISTSRPSSATPLTLDQAATAGQVQIFDNSSMYLASDSAVIYADTGETMNSGINVASMSATGIPSATNRMVYFTNTVSNAHHRGDALIVNITATHTIKFTTSSIIPASGKIILTFPGSVSANTASPSATTFSFNGMAASNPTDVKWNGVTCSSVAVAWPSITCTATSQVTGGTAITVLIGCTTGTTSCTVFAPRLINPTSSTSTSADIWQLLIQTQDNNSVTLDSSKAIIAIEESVQVQGTVEPTLTFTIAGLGTATNYNTTVSQCGSETSNSGIGSTATFVNLGDLGQSQINDAAQTLTVTTNAANGYAITSTSSGRFINPGNGFWLPDANGGNGLTSNDTPIPAVMAAGTPAFGISPCGADVPTSTPNWGGTGQTVAGGARFSNPWNTGTNGFYATIASYTGGSVAGTAGTHGVTLIRYAAAVSSTTPPGVYSTILTYVATPTF